MATPLTTVSLTDLMTDYTNTSDQSQTITGNQKDNTIQAGPAGDIIVGSGGNDTLLGGVGNDHLDGGQGNDSINGGNGNDTLFGTGGNDTLNGSLGDDFIGGGGGNDKIFGSLRNDSMAGNAGNDTLFGNAGDDTLQGNEGNDFIGGGGGNDTLRGGTGSDILYGEAGDDVYAFQLNDGKDTITDTVGKANKAGIFESSNDTLRFDATVSKDQIAIFRKGSGLQVQYGNTNSYININNYFASTTSTAAGDGAIENIEVTTGDVIGTTTYHLNFSDVNSIISAISSYAADANNHVGTLASANDVAKYSGLLAITANQFHTGA